MKSEMPFCSLIPPHITSLTSLRMILQLGSGVPRWNRWTRRADWLQQLGTRRLPSWSPVWHEQGRGTRGTVAVRLHRVQLVQVHLWRRHGSGRLSAAGHQRDRCLRLCPVWCDVFKRLEDERESLWWHGALCGFILRQRDHGVHCNQQESRDKMRVRIRSLLSRS